MSTFHGDCIGPVGAKLRHNLCPGTWASWYGKPLSCECWCHGQEGVSDAQNAPSERPTGRD